MSNLKGLGDAIKMVVQVIDVIDRSSVNEKDELPPGEVSCKTCGDTLQVGEAGHSVPCPACVVESPKCSTCKGKGKVGAKGHEVKCPVCQGKP